MKTKKCCKIQIKERGNGKLWDSLETKTYVNKCRAGSVPKKESGRESTETAS